METYWKVILIIWGILFFCPPVGTIIAMTALVITACVYFGRLGYQQHRERMWKKTMEIEKDKTKTVEDEFKNPF